MDGPPTREGTRQLEELIAAVEDLRRRVAALERRSEPVLELQTPASELSAATELSTGLLAGLGRLLLGIAGAYLLRALTGAGILPQLAGTLVGLAYAFAWLASSVRFVSASRLVMALQGLTAALIAGPLLWEATARFHSLPPAAAAGSVALFIAVGQAVAWRRDLSVIAGVAALAGSATSIALLIATLNPVPFAIALIAGAAVVELGACLDRALSTRPIIALAADFSAFLLLYLATRTQGLPEGYAPIPIPVVVAILIALAGIYIASTVTRTLIRAREIGWFELAQAAVILALGIAGGLRLGGSLAIGWVCLAIGAFCYMAAFLKMVKPARTHNFHAFATFGLLLIASGSLLVFSGIALAAVWSLLGLTGSWLGERWNKNTLRLHAAIYLGAAAAASGLLTYPAPQSRAALLCAIATALAYGVVLWTRGNRASAAAERIAAAILVALLCWSIVRLAPIGSVAGATFRTALVALIAVALAWCGRRWNVEELIWVLYPWMVFGAVKLFAEDFREGPTTLAVSLLLYGGTLIVLPRLLRKTRLSRRGLS